MFTASGASELKASALAVAVLAGLVGADVAVGGQSVLTSTYLFAPFVTAAAGAVWGTAVVAVLTYALILASGAWNDNFGSTDYDIRLVLGAVGVGFAAFAAVARREAQRSMRRLQLLEEVTSVADGSLAVDETVDRIADVLVPEVADICLIDVAAGGSPSRIAVRAEGPRREQVEEALARRRPSIPEEMVSADASISLPPVFRPRHDEEVLRSIAHDERDLEFVRSLDTRSSMTIPLVSRGHRLGALTLITAGSTRRYRRADLRFGRVLADRVALALDNAGLFSDLQSVERRMDTVMAVLDEGVVIHDGGGRILFANEAAAAGFGLDSAGALVGSSFAALGDMVDLYDDDGVPLDTDRLGDLTTDEAWPLTFRAFSRRTGAETWLRARRREIHGTAPQTTWAVTAFEDVSDLKQTEFAQTMLARTGELLRSNDYAETIQGIAELAIPQLADWCSVYVLGDDGSLEQVAMAHRDPERIAQVRKITEDYPLHRGDDSAVAQVLRTGELLAIDDVASLFDALANDPDHLRRMRSLGFGSMMVVPLRLGGEIRGTLNFVNDADRRPFDRFDAGLARRVAERAAVALENARLATERAKIAETLQHGLLPSPIPEIPGWSIAALYRPAGEQNEVGGDFYEVFPCQEGWMVAIGDVTGRGAAAASITALARHTLRTAAALTGDPQASMSALNRALLSRRDMSLCSAALIALRPERPESAEVVSAGHPPPFVVAGRDVRPVACGGPVLGAFEDAGWEPVVVELDPGQQLVCYTDGVTEAEGAAERFGEDRLRDRLRGPGSPAGAVRAVEEALERFTEGRLDDDAAIVAIMRDPPDVLLLEGIAALGEPDLAPETGAGV